MFDTSVNLIIPVIIIVSCYMCIVITMRRREHNVLFSEKSRIDERSKLDYKRNSQISSSIHKLSRIMRLQCA
jgi:hypothetical protein